MSGDRAGASGDVGVLLMSFGTAASVEDVPRYLTQVRGGTAPAAPLVEEFQRRFALVGGSPLIRICHEQAAALEAMLNDGFPGGPRYRVTIGMRHSDPTIAAGLSELVSAGARRVVGIILSPQYSPVVLAGYLRDFGEACSALSHGVETTIAGAWHDEPSFVDALAILVREALARIDPDPHDRVPIIFTAHSLPQSMAERDPDYLLQLQDTARTVAEQAGISPDRWSFAYQSAGHTREAWLTPDLVDVLPGLRDAGHRRVLVAPVQFVADHLEVLYDIDVAAREQAAALGLRLERTASPNARPGLIAALAAVVRRELHASLAQADAAQAPSSAL
jgi:ferrochelatase